MGSSRFGTPDNLDDGSPLSGRSLFGQPKKRQLDAIESDEGEDSAQTLHTLRKRRIMESEKENHTPQITVVRSVKERQATRRKQK